MWFGRGIFGIIILDIMKWRKGLGTEDWIPDKGKRVDFPTAIPENSPSARILRTPQLPENDRILGTERTEQIPSGGEQGTEFQVLRTEREILGHPRHQHHSGTEVQRLRPAGRGLPGHYCEEWGQYYALGSQVAENLEAVWQGAERARVFYFYFFYFLSLKEDKYYYFDLIL